MKITLYEGFQIDFKCPFRPIPLSKTNDRMRHGNYFTQWPNGANCFHCCESQSNFKAMGCPSEKRIRLTLALDMRGKEFRAALY